jgi:hypothetical protein
MPTPTDLVTDLPADFEVFGQAVATSMADLLGGTTGQVLSKASNTDMDFTWVAGGGGDITDVNVTSPITGGGSTGAVTVGIQDATTAQKGAVQLENSVSSTSTTTAAVPASVKTANDLAAAAIPKSTVTTNGDIIYGTGSGTVTRLGIGTAGQSLIVTSGVPAWGTPVGGYVQVATGSTTSGTSLNLTSLTTYNNYILVHTGISCGVSNDDLFIRFNNDSSAIYDTVGTYANNQSNVSINSTKTLNNFGVLFSSSSAAYIVEINNCRSTTGYKNFQITGYRSATTAGTWVGSGMYKSNTAVSSIDVIWNGGNSFDAGSYTLWGSN